MNIPAPYYLDPDGDLITRKPVNTIQLFEETHAFRRPTYKVTVFWTNGKNVNYYRKTRDEAEKLRAELTYDLVVRPLTSEVADLTAKLDTERELRLAAEKNLQALNRIAAGEESATVSGAAVPVRDEILRLRGYLDRAMSSAMSVKDASDASNPASSFTVSEEDREKIASFKAEVERRRASNASGAIGGATTYSFTPTSLGTIFKVKHFDEELDLTNYNDW